MDEAQLLQLNCDKANQKLGWYPRWDVEKSIHKTGNWYKQVADGKSSILQTEEDLKEYFLSDND